MKTWKYIIIVLLSLLSLYSCTPQSCFDVTEANVKAALYKSGKLTAPLSLTIRGQGHDTTFLYKQSAKITIASLPLDASADSSVFIIDNSGIIDTLSIRYTTYPHLISKECGYTYYHTIEEPVWTHNGIQSVVLKKNTITTANEENILIYY